MISRIIQTNPTLNNYHTIPYPSNFEDDGKNTRFKHFLPMNFITNDRKVDTFSMIFYKLRHLLFMVF